MQLLDNLKNGWLQISLIFVGCLVAACTTTSQPETLPTSQARLIDGDLPKMLITIDLTAIITPSLTPTSDASPDAEQLPPTSGLPQLPTSVVTPTVYTGVFLGEPTLAGSNVQIPTLAPIASPLPAAGSSNRNCDIAVAAPFQNAYSTNPSVQGLGCPLDAGTEISLVMQRFESGRMFWRNTRQILVLSDSSTFWRLADTWVEGMPIDDPSLAPPDGRVQPVRGFGLVWRDQFRDILGWGLGPEFQISGYWQEFSGGSLILGDNNQIYAVPSGESGQYIGSIAP